ncbi:MAG: bacteriophage N4 receptor, outer membrane subunit [Acidobacteria bacterium OLB17]|nr:MAG: bacteriophage N4 receptor, outer membrane subunit [Acidobacteria bacterium OLB17]MCZ2391407.1 tetratricopeptide repeat protein [Acidobacteriota bacterium]
MKKYIIRGVVAVFLGVMLAAAGYTQAQATDTVMVLPFENTSGKPEFNWVGESFAAALSELLAVPTLNVISNDERKIVQQRLRIPLTSLPSLATSLKLAREKGATMLITGTYNIVPASGDTAAVITVTAKIVRVNEGRFLSEYIDGKQVTRDINLTDALGNLQSIQGQIAYQILYQRDKSLPYSQNDIISTASKVPARAFEAYTKGLLTNLTDARENYFKNAIRLYAEAEPNGVYSAAALELGHLYLAEKKLNEAQDAFEQVINAYQQCLDRAKAATKPLKCNGDDYAEAAFYDGLIQLRAGRFEMALGILRPLAEDLKLTAIYNAIGVISVQGSRAEKKNSAKAAAMLAEGVALLKKAAESEPNNDNIRFNYGAALLISGDMAEAAKSLKAAIAANANDGDAYFLLAKALEELKDPAAAEADNRARQKLTANNRYASLQKEWERSKTVDDVPLRVEQPARKDFVAVILSRKQGNALQPQANETETLLAKARTMVANGQDDDAMPILRRVLASEPMSAESYLLLGKIHLRRGDIDQAISSFKTSIFWDSRKIEAHVNLGKIYVEKGDCQQAKTYAASAAEIDENNEDVIALERLADRCSK